ncbi:hypothetical protein B0H16DRAFT_1461602 [Mycena metata]|uniref:Uncharacterized protein n=1 Tax=Mycena metata TaxID=1033252 RepID=A0AAD7IR18_9AGAR|nr:hypothetical protein B0H16DRAFT_1461602 [Mycena metata]
MAPARLDGGSCGGTQRPWAEESCLRQCDPSRKSCMQPLREEESRGHMGWQRNAAGQNAIFKQGAGAAQCSAGAREQRSSIDTDLDAHGDALQTRARGYAAARSSIVQYKSAVNWVPRKFHAARWNTVLDHCTRAPCGAGAELASEWRSSADADLDARVSSALQANLSTGSAGAVASTSSEVSDARANNYVYGGAMRGVDTEIEALYTHARWRWQVEIENWQHVRAAGFDVGAPACEERKKAIGSPEYVDRDARQGSTLYVIMHVVPSASCTAMLGDLYVFMYRVVIVVGTSCNCATALSGGEGVGCEENIVGVVTIQRPSADGDLGGTSTSRARKIAAVLQFQTLRCSGYAVDRDADLDAHNQRTSAQLDEIAVDRGRAGARVHGAKDVGQREVMETQAGAAISTSAFPMHPRATAETQTTRDELNAWSPSSPAFAQQKSLVVAVNLRVQLVCVCVSNDMLRMVLRNGDEGVVIVVVEKRDIECICYLHAGALSELTAYKRNKCNRSEPSAMKQGSGWVARPNSRRSDSGVQGHQRGERPEESFGATRRLRGRIRWSRNVGSRSRRVIEGRGTNMADSCRLLAKYEELETTKAYQAFVNASMTRTESVALGSSSTSLDGAAPQDAEMLGNGMGRMLGQWRAH